MSLWMWVGAVAVVAVLGGFHWAVLDFLLDRVGTPLTDWWRDRGSASSGTDAMPEG